MRRTGDQGEQHRKNTYRANPKLLLFRSAQVIVKKHNPEVDHNLRVDFRKKVATATCGKRIASLRTWDMYFNSR